MADVFVLFHSHPDYYESIEKYFNNSVKYNGSRPLLSWVRLGHFRVRKENVPFLLSDLKNHYKEGKLEGKERKWNSFLPFMKLLRKLLGVKPIDMKEIERSGKKIPNVPWMYAFPLGTTEDFHNEFGDEEL